MSATRTITPLEFVPQLDYSDDIYARVEAIGSGPLGEAGTIAVKADRNAATDAAVAAILEQLSTEFEGRNSRARYCGDRCRTQGKRSLGGRTKTSPPAAGGPGPAPAHK